MTTSNDDHDTLTEIKRRLEAGHTATDVAAELGLETTTEHDDPSEQPAVLLPGWVARDEGGHEVAFPEAQLPWNAADRYVSDGDYPPPDETTQVHVRTWRAGIGLDEDGDIFEAEADVEHHKVRLDPEEPDCVDDGEHEWARPHLLVGGVESNPGVLGSGGGVVSTEVCLRCGCARITDTWATDMVDGTHFASIRYEVGEYDDRIVSTALDDVDAAAKLLDDDDWADSVRRVREGEEAENIVGEAEEACAQAGICVPESVVERVAALLVRDAAETETEAEPA